MKKVKITVMRKVRHDDLIEKYENPLEHECDVEEGRFHRKRLGKTGQFLRQCLGERFTICHGIGQWRKRFL